MLNTVYRLRYYATVCVGIKSYSDAFIYQLSQITPLVNDLLRDSTPLVNGLKSYSMYIFRRRQWRKIVQSMDCVSHILRCYLLTALGAKFSVWSKSKHARRFKFINPTANQTSFDAAAICKSKLFDREIYRQFWNIYLYH